MIVLALLGVGPILFEAGLRLRPDELRGREGAPSHDGVTPMFVLSESGELTIVTAGLSPEAPAGHTTTGLTGAGAG